LNILLPTYSYHPYQYGGTEIYVSGLANYLTTKGHNVTIIAGMPSTAFDEHDLFFEDDNLKTIIYFQNEIRIVGVILKETKVHDIYRKYRLEWVSSWLKVIQKLDTAYWNIIHIHANTSAIGISLVKAVKIHSPQINTVASYHLPLSCVKGTLLFGNLMKACNVKPNRNICTACFISDKKNIPLKISSPVAFMMPMWKNEKFPTDLKLKYLVNEFIESFNLFCMEIDQWHVFSMQITSILLLNKIDPSNILLLDHGVNPVFNIDDYLIRQRQKLKQTNFLYAGRFDQAKGFITLLKAWCSLPELADRILVVVGQKQNEDIILTNWLKEAAKRKDIKWMGVQPQEQVAILMKNAHCAIIPSECIEIGPLVFHEAIAAGCDVLTSDIGGCKELGKIYAGKTTLFKAAKSNVLAQKIIDFNYSGLRINVTDQLENYGKILNAYQALKYRAIGSLKELL